MSNIKNKNKFMKLEYKMKKKALKISLSDLPE